MFYLQIYYIIYIWKYIIYIIFIIYLGFLCGSASKESTCNVEDLDSIPELGRFPGEGKGYPLQYSSLEYSMDCMVHGSQRAGHDWATFTRYYIFILFIIVKFIYFYFWLCHTRDYSCCSEQELLSSCVAQASLSRGGFSCCGAQAV